MPGLTIKTAILLNILGVYGNEYQDVFLKDDGHITRNHLRYSEENVRASEDNNNKNVYWKQTPGHPHFQYQMSVPNWVQRHRIRFGSDSEERWPDDDNVRKLFPIYPRYDIEQGTEREFGQDWPKYGGVRNLFPKRPGVKDIGVGFASVSEPSWLRDDIIRKFFPRLPDYSNLGLGMGSEPKQDFPGNSLTDWFLTPGEINDSIVQGVGSGKRWPGGLLDWYPRFPDNDYDDELGTESEPEKRRQGDNEICQNIKGLPDPESGCCGVQLKRFPIHRVHEQWWPLFFKSRFRRSTESDLRPDQMIKGGEPTKIHQLPWMARILIDSYVPDFGAPKGCGGSIISSRYILTAAHCIHQQFKELRQVKVFLSEYDTTTYPEDCVGDQCIQNVEMAVEHVTIHPKFNHTHLQNDVALLRLKERIPYTDFIRPICLPTLDIKNLSSKPILIAGWGKNGKTESNLKRSAFIQYVEDEECRRYYSYKDPTLFCSIGGNGEDICHGDSGGPLMVIHEKRVYLSGVVNGRREECGSPLPSLFNNVYYHLEWIKKHVKE